MDNEPELSEQEIEKLVVADTSEPVPEYDEATEREEAKKYMRLFFADKSNYFGGRINLYNERGSQYLLDDRYVRLVSRIGWEDAVDLAYSAMNDPQNKKWKLRWCSEVKGKMNFETVKWLEIMRMCSSLAIPRKFAVGIAIVYLELCEGLKFR